MKATLETVLGDLRLVADGQSAAATARASIRETIPTLFPESPTQAEIDAVVNADAWQDFDGKARRIFAEAWTTAPRMVKFDSDSEAESYEPTAADLDLWVADKKTAKDYAPSQTAIRKAIQAYVRVSVKQNITDFIPEASDAAETVTAPALPDPTQVLAMVTEALIILSEHKKDAALALLNGLDALVTVSRKPLAEGKALPRKA
jgi:predicted RNA-binding Zn ribbon-like protein